MVQHHGWSLFEIEEMMPWERDIYASLLKQHVDAENAKIEEQNRKMKRG